MEIWYFLEAFRKDSLSKIRTEIWNFLYYMKQIMFLFPGNMILFYRPKMKDDLSQKNTTKYESFCKLCEKIVFPKIFFEIRSFFNYQESWYFYFPRDMIYVFISSLWIDMFKSFYNTTNPVLSKSNLYR